MSKTTTIKITTDTVTDGSEDPISSDGVYEEFQGLATVATSGSYTDLDHKPTIPDISGKANSADLAAVATSGSYDDLLDKPTIPENIDLSNYVNNSKMIDIINYASNQFIEDSTIQITCDANIPYAADSTFTIKGTLFAPNRIANADISLYIDDTLEETKTTNYDGEVIYNVAIPAVGTQMDIELKYNGSTIYKSSQASTTATIINSLNIQGANGRNYYPNVSSDLVLTVTSSYTDTELGNMKLYLNNGLVSSSVHKGDYTIYGEMLVQAGYNNTIVAKVVSETLGLEATVTLVHNS